MRPERNAALVRERPHELVEADAGSAAIPPGVPREEKAGGRCSRAVAGRRVLVCGGRDFADRVLLFAVLDREHAARPIALIIEGGAKGADRLAASWAQGRKVDVASYPADWEGYGKAAGPMRNRRMLAEAQPDVVIAFRGGAGTRDCVRRAESAGITVARIGWS